MFAGIPASRRQLRAVYRARPARELRAGPHELARHEPGPDRADRQAARRRHRWQGHAGGADPRGERYTRNGALQINANGELVTAPATRCIGDSGPIVFQATDRDISITEDGTIKVREGISVNSDSPRGKLALVSFDQSAGCRRTAPRPSPRRTASTPQAGRKRHTSLQGSIEKSNVRGVVEMTRMIEITRSYSEVAAMLQQQATCARSAIEQARRSSGLRRRR